MKIAHLVCTIPLCGLLTSCDPVYNVGFINDSKEPVVVNALITDQFITQPDMVLSLKP